MSDDKIKIRTFKDLVVWQKGHELVLMLYRATSKFPKEEQFGLVSQMRRSAVSITSNIAEGFIRKSYKEKLNFYLISKGSLVELENQVLISRDVGYMNQSEYEAIDDQIIKVRMLISAFINKTSEMMQNRSSEFRVRSS